MQLRSAPGSVLVVGGSGFIGAHVVQRLVELGVRVTVPTRYRENSKHLLPLPTVDVVEANVLDRNDLEQLVIGQDAVINLVGVLQGGSGKGKDAPYGKGFERAHVAVPKALVSMCLQRNVRRLVHVSALGADINGPSGYLRSKGEGERFVMNWNGPLDVTVFRPSVVFGEGDEFLNLFAKLARYFPVLPLARASARLQPIHVADVADSIVASLTDRASYGKAYDLCGPKVYTLSELVRMVAKATGHPRMVLPLPDALGYLQAFMLELLPGSLMTRDNFRSLKVDSVCGQRPSPTGYAQPRMALEAQLPAMFGPRSRA